MLDVALDRRALRTPARRPTVTNGAIVTPGTDLDQAVDHDLPVEDVDAGGDHDRIADRHLRERHRQPVREPRKHGTPSACRRAFSR